MSTGTQAANDKEVPPSANKIQQPSAETSAAVKQPPDGGNAAVSQRPIPTTDAKAERTKPTPSGYRENSTTTARPSEVESVKATDAGGGPANASLPSIEPMPRISTSAPSRFRKTVQF